MKILNKSQAKHRNNTLWLESKFYCKIGVLTQEEL